MTVSNQPDEPLETSVERDDTEPGEVHAQNVPMAPLGSDGDYYYGSAHFATEPDPEYVDH